MERAGRGPGSRGRGVDHIAPSGLGQGQDFWLLFSVTWEGSELECDAHELTEVLIRILWLWRTDFSRARGKEGSEPSEKGD